MRSRRERSGYRSRAVLGLVLLALAGVAAVPAGAARTRSVPPFDRANASAGARTGGEPVKPPLVTGSGTARAIARDGSFDMDLSYNSEDPLHDVGGADGLTQFWLNGGLFGRSYTGVRIRLDGEWTATFGQPLPPGSAVVLLRLSVERLDRALDPQPGNLRYLWIVDRSVFWLDHVLKGDPHCPPASVALGCVQKGRLPGEILVKFSGSWTGPELGHDLRITLYGSAGVGQRQKATLEVKGRIVSLSPYYGK